MPAARNLPPIEGNLAEGIVIKPDQSSPDRPIVKHKIAEFDEQRYGESQPFDVNQRLTIDQLHTVAMSMVNPARLAGARSKVGTGGLMDEIVLDVMIDLADAFPAAMAGLDRADELRLQEATMEKTRETHLGRYV